LTLAEAAIYEICGAVVAPQNSGEDQLRLSVRAREGLMSVHTGTLHKRLRAIFSAIPLFATLLILGGWLASSAHAAPPYQKTVAGVTDASRGDTFNDFLRAVWVDPGTQVTYIGRNDQYVKNLRAFFTATTFLRPAVTVDQYVDLVGNVFQTQKDLVLMRCRPSSAQRGTLDPLLATWPNVFDAIVADFQGSYSCPPVPTDGNNVIYCAALNYQTNYRDVAQSVFPVAMQNLFDIAGPLSATAVAAAALKTNYGIYPQFTGLGFTVDTSGNTPAMTPTTILRYSVVPEYLLDNLPLADAGCRCIQVGPYGNKKTPDLRHRAPVDPDYIWQRGRLTSGGACREIRRLGRAGSADPGSVAASAGFAQRDAWARKP
jgi:hypothetical protein